ncbi:MAG: hypothetical protein B7C24_14735 [Bacteroidetes bacterium 4572_77]|nr:MAG: hypothetical protein B7C24_14735 [Bacteroidetes bacterium 4572_77]
MPSGILYPYIFLFLLVPKIHKIIILFFLLTSMSLYGQNMHYKSLYIYNFAKKIEWPSSTMDSTFKIIIIGDKQSYLAMQNIAQKKRIGEQRIIVMQAQDIKEEIDVQLIYVDYSKRKLLEEINEWIKNKPILLISDYKNAKQTDINLIENHEGLEFTIRSEKIKKKGLIISDQLLHLAKKEN